MEWIHKVLHGLNELTGFFLFVIAMSIASCSKALHAIRLDLECLHEDFDTTHDAHDRQHFEQQSKMDDEIAGHVKAAQRRDSPYDR